jgi:hypothetical protein
MPAPWSAAFVLSDKPTGSRSKIRVSDDLVCVRGWQPGLVNDFVALRDDLRTHTEASGSRMGARGGRRKRRGRRR